MDDSPQQMRAAPERAPASHLDLEGPVLAALPANPTHPSTPPPAAAAMPVPTQLVRKEVPHFVPSAKEFFTALNEFTAGTGLSLQDFYNLFDDEDNGVLDKQQLGRLVQTLLPDAQHPSTLRYMHVLLDDAGAERVPLSSLEGLMRKCSLFGVDIEVQSAFGIKDVLLKLAGLMLDQDKSAKEVFMQFDHTGRGLLDESGLARMFKALMPGLTSEELTTLVAKWKSMNFQDVQQSMQWVTAKRAKGMRRLAGGGPSENRTPIKAASQSRPASMTSTPNIKGIGEAPPASTRLKPQSELERSHANAGEAAGSRSSNDLSLLQAVQEYLTEHNTDLKSLFRRFDNQSRGYLDEVQFRSFVESLLPNTSWKKSRYYLVMLASSRGGVTCEDIERARQEVRLLQYDLHGRHNLAVKDVLFRMASHLLHTRVRVEELLASHNVSSIPEAASATSLVLQLLPALSDDEQSSLVAKWAAMSPDDLQQALNWVHSHTGGAEPPSGSVSPKGIEIGQDCTTSSIGTAQASAASASNEPSIVHALQEYLQQGAQDLSALFSQFDKHNCGYLKEDRWRDFVEHLLPGIDSKKVHYFHLILSSGETGVTLNDLKQIIKDSALLKYDVRARARIAVKDVLFKMAAHVLQYNKTLDGFLLDYKNAGGLDDYDAVTSLMKRLVPALAFDERAKLVEKWVLMSEEELNHSLRWVNARILRAKNVGIQ